MRFCLTYLHQVQGTLQMVEFYGAALLAEEMEFVARYVDAHSGEGRADSDGLDALMRAKKDFTFVPLPRQLHGPQDPAARTN